MRIVDLSDPPPIDVGRPPGVVVAVGTAVTAAAEYWLDESTFALTDAAHDDRRTVTVASVPDALARLTERCGRWPQASAVCDDVLRSVDPAGPTLPGIVTESLAYSTLQSGPEFARWLAERGPAALPDIPDPVQAERYDDTLRIRFNRPQRHNAFSTDVRALLLEALTVALLDDTVTEMVLAGNGPSFCSGGDLAEFGTFADPASAHLARTRHSPALALDELSRRLGAAAAPRFTAGYSAAGWRWPPSAGGCGADPTRYWGCPSWRSA